MPSPSKEAVAAVAAVGTSTAEVPASASLRLPCVPRPGSTKAAKLLLLLLLLLLLQIGSIRCAPQQYTSVRALDGYGNSEQLNHAREAAVRHGRSIVAARSAAAEEVVIVSVGNSPVAQPVTVPSGPESDDAPVAMCCAGVRADATWLVEQVRSHAKQVWARYDHRLDANAVSHLVARLLGSYLGNQGEHEWQPSVTRKHTDWSRPLGVQALIVSCDSPILTVEPSGRVLMMATENGHRTHATVSSENKDEAGSDDSSRAQQSFGCIGMHSTELVKKLMRGDVYRSMSTQDLERYLLDLLCSICEPKEHTLVQIERISRRGVTRRTATWTDGKLLDDT